MFDNRKNSFSLILLITYLMVLVLPLVACAFIYNSSTTLIEERFEHYDDLLSQELMHEIDDLFKNYTMIKNRVLQNNHLYSLASDSSDAPADPEKISALSAELAHYQTEIHSTGEIYIYFPQHGFLLNSHGYLDTVDEFVDLFSYNRTLRGNLIYSEETGYYQLSNKEDTACLIYQTPLIVTENGCSAKLIVNENTDILIQNINRMKENLHLEYIIFDTMGERVLSSPNFMGVTPTEIYAQYHRSGYYRFLGQKYDVISNTSADTKLEYLLVLADPVMNRRMVSYRVISILCILLTAGLGAVLILMFIRQNRKSIASILEMIAPIYQMEGVGMENEFYRIKATIKSLISEQNSFQNKLLSISEKLSREYMTNLILGRGVNKEGKKDLAGMLPFDFSRGGFRIVAFKISSVKHLFENEDMTDEERKTDAEFIIKNVFDELMHPNATPLLQINNTLVSIFQTPVFYENLLQNLNKGKQVILEQFAIGFQIAVSDSCDNIMNIASCYHQACFLLETPEASDFQLITAGLLKKKELGNIFYPYLSDSEEALVRSLKAKNYEKTSMLLDSLFSSASQLPLKAENITYCLVYSVLGTVVRYICEFEYNNIISGIWEQIEEILESEDLGLAKDNLYLLCENLCHINVPQMKVDIVSKVTDIVAKEYQNNNLSVSYIADLLNLHNVYLSTLFKEKNGCGLLEFISRYRIDKAKEVLCMQPGITIEEVARMVGYDNAKTFSRIFKKYEGTTPGKFRESTQN